MDLKWYNTKLGVTPIRPLKALIAEVWGSTLQQMASYPSSPKVTFSPNINPTIDKGIILKVSSKLRSKD